MQFSRGADGSPLCVAKRTLLKLLPNNGAKPKPKPEQTYARKLRYEAAMNGDAGSREVVSRNGITKRNDGFPLGSDICGP